MLQRPAAGLLVVALLALSGCSDDSSSPTDPPTTAPTSPTSSSTPPETEAPETPEAFVRRWVEVDRKMQTSGETSEYRALTPRCTACSALADQIDRIYAAGGYVKTKGLIVRKVKAGAPDANGEVEVQLDARSTPTAYKESSGGEKQTLPGGLVTYTITLHSKAQSWVVTLLERLVA